MVQATSHILILVKTQSFWWGSYCQSFGGKLSTKSAHFAENFKNVIEVYGSLMQEEFQRYLIVLCKRQIVLLREQEVGITERVLVLTRLLVVLILKA